MTKSTDPKSEYEVDSLAFKNTVLEDETPNSASPDELEKTESLVLKDRYVDIEVIGKGGMSIVKKALDRNLNRMVARKILRVDDEKMKELFVKEAKITSQLEHPNIVSIYDYYEGDKPYITMQLVEGERFDKLLQSERHNPGSCDDIFNAIQVLLKICDAIGFAHSKGIIHRDLKPSNIMVGEYGQVYLMDWGIANYVAIKLDSVVSGTPRYFSPEQADPANSLIDERTDTFALGAILYEILTQRPLYQADSIDAYLQLARRCEIESPQNLVKNIKLPSELCNIAVKALSKEPDQRFQSAEELSAVLKSFLSHVESFPQKRFKANEQVIKQGTEGHDAYIINEGYCQVYTIIDNQKSILQKMGPGDVFGEMAVFSSKRRSASVETTSDALVTVIDKDTLLNQVNIDSWAGAFVVGMAKRFDRLDRDYMLTNANLKQRECLNSILSLIMQMGSYNLQHRHFVISWELLLEKLVESNPHYTENRVHQYVRDVAEFILNEEDAQLIYQPELGH